MSALHDPTVRGFASDNYAGVLPEVLDAIAEANLGHQGAYGADVYTTALGERIKELFGEAAQAFPVFNGTGANVVALSAVCDRWSAVVCADSGHIHVDEGGAPEKLAGLKLFVVPADGGKLTPEAISAVVPERAGDVHFSQPRVLSVAQSTELGTVYTPGELRALAQYAHGRGWLLHIDGSRLANAAASLGVGLRAITTDIGADIVSVGGTKSGLLGAELVVVLNAEPEGSGTSGIEYVRKLSMQLASKQRFLAAQFLALFQDDRYLRVAAHANAMATLLAELVGDLDGVHITAPVQANAVFAEIPHAAAEALMQTVPFYFWDEARGEVRWMCAWDTTEEDVRSFAELVRSRLS
ncbi:low specificity L-threonine aldolase [Tsukamurella serpentis]